MVDDLDALVRVESPSVDIEANRRCAAVVTGIGERLLGSRPEAVSRDGGEHLLWRSAGPVRVLLLGHSDTVWPLGTLSRLPFDVVDGVATGPGCFDMKAGLVQLFHALSVLDDLDGVAVLVTSDEEVGSPTSRRLIEEVARDAHAALVLEASAAGALKTARKGAAHYRLTARGRAAHAGLEPERGVNAIVELAHQVLAIAALAAPDRGTSVTPTLVEAGTAANTVPALGNLSIDVRAGTVAEQMRVDSALRRLVGRTEDAVLTWSGGPHRPPMEPSASAQLFATAARVAAGLGLGALAGVGVGGASDGNLTAGIGVPTLDGLGAVGGGAHADDEHVVVAAMPERAALLAGLVETLLRAGAGS